MSQNAIEPGEQALIDNAGMPSIGRTKNGNKFIKAGALTVAGGVVLFVLVTMGRDHTSTKNASVPSDEVASHITPFVPDKPMHLTAADSIPFTPAATSATAATQQSGTTPQTGTAPTPKWPPTWIERNMGQTAGDNTAQLGATSAPGGSSAAVPPPGAPGAPGAPDAPPAPPAPPVRPLAAMLEPTEFHGVSAGMMPDRDFTNSAGTMIDCILDTRIVSTLPGPIKCHLGRDLYSDSKRVVTMDAGTEIIGEHPGEIKQGEARIFAVLGRARTSRGVNVNINSPATDTLGGTGIEGWVDTQFGKRFGAALTMSLIRDATALLIARQSSGGGQNTLVLGNTTQTGGTMAEKTLEETVKIKPVQYTNEGTHIQVMLVRDLYFPMYQLRRSAP